MNPMPPHVGQQFHQLPMFMSAREIRAQYQALDGDRDLVYGDDGWNDHPETDDQLFDRKYEEAHETDDFDSGHTLADSVRWDGVRNPISLQVAQEKPAHRFDLPTPTVGSLGKPQILGGHHRLAVMDRHRPDDLMPVAHFEDALQAHKSLGAKY
jgi:hypothetical protein